MTSTAAQLLVGLIGIAGVVGVFAVLNGIAFGALVAVPCLAVVLWYTGRYVN